MKKAPRSAPQLPQRALRGALTLAALALASSANLAEGSTALKMSCEEMTRRAESVIYGTVEGLKVGRPQNSRMIYTEVTVRVAETWKGQAGATFTFRHIGGVLGGRGLRISGAAHFKVGEEVVLFVGKADPKSGCAFTVGLAQGKFRVERSAGQKLVRQALGDLDLVERRTGQPAKDEPATRRLQFSELRRRVQSALNKRGQ